MGEGRVWDLGAQRTFSALRLKILMPGAKKPAPGAKVPHPRPLPSGRGCKFVRECVLHCQARKSTVSDQAEGGSLYRFQARKRTGAEGQSGCATFSAGSSA